MSLTNFFYEWFNVHQNLAEENHSSYYQIEVDTIDIRHDEIK